MIPILLTLIKIMLLLYGVQLFFVGLIFYSNAFKGSKTIFLKNLIPFYWLKLAINKVIEETVDRWNQLDNPRYGEHD